MPDLDKFQCNNERNCSKFKETRQIALYLFERTVSFGLVWVGPGFKRPARGGFKSGWFLKNYTIKCVQKLKNVKSERSDCGHFCVHNRRSRR